MNHIKRFCAITLPCSFTLAQALSSAQAVALVKQAVAFAKLNGVAKHIQEMNHTNGKYHMIFGSELYIFIYDERGVGKTIGYNTAALVGKNRIDLKDPDEVMIVRELINVVQTKGKGWVDYKYPNPTTSAIEQKTSYIEFYDDLLIGSGIYNEE